MESTMLLPALLHFFFAAAVVIAAAGCWEHWQRRRGWRRTAEAVARVTGGTRSVPGPTPAPVLRQAGAATSLPLVRWLSNLLEQAAVSWGVAGFLVRAGGYGLLLTLVLLIVARNPLVVPPALGIGLLIPYLQLRRARGRRIGRFEEQFPEAIDLLARAIRAGHPFSAGLKMVAEETRDPLATEFRQVFEEQKFGLSVSESLQGLSRRIDLLDVQIFVTAVSIQREVGGNLAEILDQISLTIRERFKIQRQVGVYTAQGRMTGVLLALLPVGLGALLTIINPSYMGGLVSEPAGRAMLAAAGIMQLVGYGLIRRITTIEV